MLSGLSVLYQVTQYDKYKKAIEKNAAFLLSEMVDEDRLYRSYKEGKIKQDAFIEDYAFVANGLLDASFALQQTEYYLKAMDLTNYAKEHFWDKNDGGYFTTSDLQEKLFQRLKDESDQSIPSATGIMLNVLLRFFSLSDKPEYLDKCETIFKAYAEDMIKNPYGFCSYINALDLYINGIRLIVIIYPDDASVKLWQDFLYKRYNPDEIILFLDKSDFENKLFPAALKGKKIKDNKITAYVCQNFQCSLAITDLDGLAKELNKTG